MGVLLMLMTIGGLLVAGILFLIALYTNKAWLAKFVFGGVAVWFVFYFAMLFGFSFTSEEKNLGLNEPKEFCGFYLDCHMHIAVTDVYKTKTIGGRRAKGEFYVVTVKVFSDAKAATLHLGRLKLIAIDDEGGLHPHVPELENPDPPFTQPVEAGGSFEREVIFDLPAGQEHPRLDAYGYPNAIEAFVEKFLVGDEDSIFHKRNYFKLEEQTHIMSVN